MINERRGALFIQTKFFVNQRNIIIEASRPVSSRIVPQSAEHGINRTIEKDQRADRGDGGNVFGLSGVPWDPVKYQHIVGGMAGAVKERTDDLSGEREMLVFEQQALIENTRDKRDLGRSIGQRWIVA